jgi:hypothetical protein
MKTVNFTFGVQFRFTGQFLVCFLVTVAAFESDLMPKNSSETDVSVSSDNFINVPATECDTPTQLDFAELKYVEMIPACEETSKPGVCGIRRHRNITLISKFVSKHPYEQLRVRVHLVDKNFGFETAVWPVCLASVKIFITGVPNESTPMTKCNMLLYPKYRNSARATLSSTLPVLEKVEWFIRLCTQNFPEKFHL